MYGIKNGSVIKLFNETCIVMSDWTLYDEGVDEHSGFNDFLEGEFDKGDLDGYHYGNGNSKSYGTPNRWVDVYSERWGLRRLVLCDNVGPRGGGIREWFEVGTDIYGKKYLGYGDKPVLVK